MKYILHLLFNARSLILITLIVFAFPAESGNPYSLGDLNRIMNQKMQQIDESAQLRTQLITECANGNDNACTSVGVSPEDPCRPYLANNAQRNACRVQQCNDGNQAECNKLNVYNERKQNATNDLQRARENNSTRTCESYCMRSKISCGSSCRSFNPTDSSCSENCERDFTLCKSNC